MATAKQKKAREKKIRLNQKNARKAGRVIIGETPQVAAKTGGSGGGKSG